MYKVQLALLITFYYYGVCKAMLQLCQSNSDLPQFWYTVLTFIQHSMFFSFSNSYFFEIHHNEVANLSKTSIILQIFQTIMYINSTFKFIASNATGFKKKPLKIFYQISKD